MINWQVGILKLSRHRGQLFWLYEGGVLVFLFDLGIELRRGEMSCLFDYAIE